MLKMFGLAFMLIALLPTSHGIDCSTVKCTKPFCKYGSYTPKGKCCLVCKPDCSIVRCARPICKYGFYTPEGNCCPVCKPDCSRVRCANLVCKYGSYTPDGTCCPVCKDCSMVLCVRPNCDDSYTPEGECCPVCPSACLQPPKTGPCRAAIQRYFYNTETCQCESFTWGGCQPNGNNFPSPASCQAACKTPMKFNPVCKFPKISGICKAYMPRWFYNSTSCRCEQFIYGGCGGNANRFFTADECKTNCGCHDCNACNLPIKPHDGGNVCAAYFPSYGYNTTSCQCEKFIYSGCGGNANRFGTFDECDEFCAHTDCKTDVCDLPIKPHGGGDTICLAYIPSYGYNSTSCKCEMFIYSGCGGNANRFGTLEECRARCKNHNCEQQISCDIPADPGPCKAFVKRFFYDPLDCKCKLFMYGGCEGNGNNFPSKKVCKKSCESTCPLCSEPMKVEPCKAAEKRFFYDSQTNKCKQFSRGGCLSDGNNFRKKKLCNKLCKKPICSLPAFIGPCDAAIKRYYYDVATGKCQQFWWGGCDSNGNNFRSRKACKRKCIKQK
ncbi:papilin-like [Mercenaria mercenaria]|uniref:papilin-like n=1 Tax=Mercenaria mercenaria TaxID=6596 RepID=UPI00234F49A5|nr:papilin-like [Mercenaria mercenaria]